MFKIRAATEQDASAIAHVHVQSWRTTYTGIIAESYLVSLNETDRASSWREWLNLDIQAFVADLDGKIVGFVSGGAIREPIENYDAELFTIYLLQEAQQHGIGTSLLKALAKSLDAKGFKSMVAWMLESNSSSHFYEKTGALPISSKQMEIGGAPFTELAYGWADLNALARSQPTPELNPE